MRPRKVRVPCPTEPPMTHPALRKRCERFARCRRAGDRPAASRDDEAMMMCEGGHDHFPPEIAIHTRVLSRLVPASRLSQGPARVDGQNKLGNDVCLCCAVGHEQPVVDASVRTSCRCRAHKVKLRIRRTSRVVALGFASARFSAACAFASARVLQAALRASRSARVSPAVRRPRRGRLRRRSG